MLPNCDYSAAMPPAVRKILPRRRSTGGADYLDFKLADLLAQGVAIDAQEIGGADLVAARGGERGRQQRIFDLPQDPMIEAGRRQGAVEIGEIFAEVPLDGERKLLLGCGLLLGQRHKRGLCQLRI